MSDFRFFRRLATDIDVAPAIAELGERSDLWSYIKVRQDYEGSAHTDTETIVLRGPETAENLFDNLEAVDYGYFVQMPETRDLIDQAIRPLHYRDIGRIMVVKLKAGGVITSHVDEGAYARYFARFHLVLESSPHCLFRVGSEVVHMAPGELWWFDHQVEHSVVNTNGPERTHIIIDLCAPGFTGALARAA